MRIALPEHKRWVHSSTLKVRWSDMDSVGHVNNAIYFRYMEQARLEWFYREKLSPAVDGKGPVIANTFCNYARELTYPDEVLMHLYVSDAARTTFETWVTMERTAEPGVICATGGATVIWIDRVQKKAITLPDRVRQLIEGAGA